MVVDFTTEKTSWGFPRGVSGAETRIAMLKASVAFVEKHNPADPAPPAKAAP